MKFPWTVQRKSTSPAEEKLQQIKDILFPQLERHVDKNGDIMYIDSTCDMNLLSVITDLEEGFNDEVTRQTLVDISKRIEKVRSVLKVLSEFDPEAKYIIVDSNPKLSDLDEIKAAD